LTGPPGAQFSFRGAGVPEFNGTVGRPLAPAARLPYWNSSLVYAGSRNNRLGAPNGTLSFVAGNGTEYMVWNRGPQHSTYLSLNFRYQNLSAFTGISLTLQGLPVNASNLRLNLVLPQTTLSVPSYISNDSAQGPSTTYSFYFSDATNATSSAPVNRTVLAGALKEMTEFDVVLPDTGLTSSFAWSNLTGFTNTTGPFTFYSLGSAPVVPSTPWTWTASAPVLLDTISAQLGRQPTSSPRVDLYTPQSDVTDARVTLPTSGWYVVQLAQTYSALWTLTGPVESSSHVIVNVGLNGWLVHASGPVPVQLVYGGGTWVVLGSVVEGVGLVLFVLAVVVARRWDLPRHGFQLRPSPGSKLRHDSGDSDEPTNS
jgi:hypothetical protein